MPTSRLPGFHGWSLQRRRETLAQLFGRPLADLAPLEPGALATELADKLVENVVGVLGLPVGLGMNLIVNGEELIVPMAVEEPSVIAAFSHAAKMARAGGGFEAEADPSHMIGQLQLCPADDRAADAVQAALEAQRARLEDAARRASEGMAARGGGFVRLELRRLSDPAGGTPMVVLHVIVDVVDAMGANAVNHVLETIAPEVAAIAGVPVLLRILSNLAVHRLARARARIPVESVGGLAVALRIAEADRFARLDPFRAATHNKGIFNGIDAVAMATGNDWRSIEAGGHAYAARDGQYRGLTRWRVEDGHLAGELELPMAVGTVGGLIQSHPTVRLLRELVGAPRARKLAGILAAVGLAQNLAALRALSDEGIQAGHMALHARQLALAAGASADEVAAVVARASSEGPISADRVARALDELRRGAAR
jgi:hydroxymethylglutaryl-CoA reductase